MVDTVERGDHSVFAGEVVDAGLPKPIEGRADDATLWLKELGAERLLRRLTRFPLTLPSPPRRGRGDYALPLP